MFNLISLVRSLRPSGVLSSGSGNILDIYTPIIGGTHPRNLTNLPSWINESHRRRICSYIALGQLAECADPMTPAQQKANTIRTRLGDYPYVTGVVRDLIVGGRQRFEVLDATKEGAPVEAVRLQEDLDSWSTKSAVWGKIQASETDATQLGDGFLRCRYSREVPSGKPAVVVDTLHPSECFPEYNQDGAMTAFNLLWEEEKEVDGVRRELLFRHRYEYDDAGRPVETAAWYEPATWATKPTVVVYLNGPDGAPIRRRVIDAPRIPVFHIRNTIDASFFGRSEASDARLYDAFREANHTATDVATSASVGGNPPLIVKNMIRRRRERDNPEALMTVGAGQVWEADQANYLDNSGLLTVLLEKYEPWIQNKIVVHSRIGRLFSGGGERLRDIESSRALKMLLAALYSKIEQRRSAREPVYEDIRQVLLYMLQQARIIGKILPTQTKLGTILPADNAELIEQLVKLWAGGKGSLSEETAVQLGLEAGVPILDAEREITRLKERTQLLHGTNHPSASPGDARTPTDPDPNPGSATPTAPAA
jgi:hypothetical protein